MLLSKINIWTLQYLVGSMTSIVVVLFVYLKMRTTTLKNLFSIYGGLVAGWNVFVFLHRNAASRYLSSVFFSFSLVIGFFLFSLIVLILSYLYNKNKGYWLVLLIPIVSSSLTLFKTSFTIEKSMYGWTYTLLPWFRNVLFFSMYPLLIGAIILGVYLIKKINTKVEILRVRLITAGIGIYLIGITLTNIILLFQPSFPPFGGILITIEFLLIAYGISMPPLRMSSHGEDESEDLLRLYVDFFRDFQKNIPNERFGQAEIFLEGSLETMGLDETIEWNEDGKIVVNEDELESRNIGELIETILKGLKYISPLEGGFKSLSDLINFTYHEIKDEDREKANKWKNRILKDHGIFLAKNDMLIDLDFVKDFSDILDEIQEKQIILKPMEKPLLIYDELADLQKLGYDVKCITKYSSHKINKKENCDPTNMLNIMEYIDKDKDSFSSDKILEEIEDRWDLEENTVLIIDCFDILMPSLGKEESMTLIRSLRKKQKFPLVIGYNKEILREDESKLRELSSW